MNQPKKYKQETVDVTKLQDLVPSEYLPKINLLFNKDVAKQPNTASELIIHRLAQLKETDIQQHFHKEFNAFACEMRIFNKSNELEFVQNDNGDTAGSKLTGTQRMVLHKRKKAEGSRKGFPDVSMYVSNGQKRDTVFCEVKKIAAPSAIHLYKEQLEWFLKLNRMGFDAYITNNPTFFREVVLGKIKNILK